MLTTGGKVAMSIKRKDRRVGCFVFNISRIYALSVDSLRLGGEGDEGMSGVFPLHTHPNLPLP